MDYNQTKQLAEALIKAAEIVAAGLTAIANAIKHK